MGPRAGPGSQLVLDLIARSGRVVVDEVVEDAHVSVDRFEELLLASLHLAFYLLLLRDQLLADERLSVLLHRR